MCRLEEVAPDPLIAPELHNKPVHVPPLTVPHYNIKLECR